MLVMNDNTSLRKELQKELLSEIDKCKSTYSTLLNMQHEINKEIVDCNEHFIHCFIEYKLLEESLMDTNTRTNEVTETYQNRFKKGVETDWSNYNCGMFMYNYGDVLFDEKYNMKAIVLNETKVFITLWYYAQEEDELVVKQRKKNDTKLVVIRRCSM